jgi:hypothetical protein
MRLLDRLLNFPDAVQATAFAAIIALSAAGCSSYKLAPITEAEAKSDFSAGETYKVSPPGAFLRRSWSTGAAGVGQPRFELTRWNSPEFPALHEVPVGTQVQIEKLVRFDQSGLYDCGFNGWRFAIGRVQSGELRGTLFLIDSSDLARGPESCVLSEQ